LRGYIGQIDLNRGDDFMNSKIGGFIIAMLLLTSLANAKTPAKISLVSSVDALVEEEMNKSHIAGLSLAIAKDGTVTYSRGYGFADVKQKSPATEQTVFEIGSISKQFLATGILMLVEDGKLTLEDKAKSFFPDAPASWDAITIRHLLTHTSGLQRAPIGYNPHLDQADADLIRKSYRAPVATPGSEYSYSNLGYFVLAEIITRVTRDRWSKFIAARVFDPSAMTITRTTKETARLAHVAKGYNYKNKRWVATPVVLALRPSGAFVSTVIEMAQWDAVLRTDKVLTEASRKQMWTPMGLNDGTVSAYGFGWHLVGVHNVVKHVWHDGVEPGFKAFMLRYLDEGITVIVLTNTGDGTNLHTLCLKIAKLYGAPEREAGTAEKASRDRRMDR
jgi:D-alanyl-D-alanine carboxypeptidase